MGYYLRRTAQAILTLIIVVSITFVLFRLMPGGPIQAMKNRLIRQAAATGTAVNIDRINEMVELYTGIMPDQPIYIQYINYLRDIILYQDFGESIRYSQPVFDILFEAMPWSVFISVYGLALGYTANILLGAVMAYKEGSRFDQISTVGSIFLNSIPYYVGAIVLLAIFAYDLEWFPTGGRYNTDLDPGFNVFFMISILRHAALPILSGFIVGFGGRALSMRGNSVRILGEDYLRVARLRGISSTRIATRYVARNAILPMYTNLMIGISAIFSSSVILEYIFTYPGVGWFTFGALKARDYPLLMGSFLFFTTITIIGILIADFTYGIVDPRASTGDQDEAF
ncbi:peptide/nickel transport system permease protein [Haladaptatus litoreus]|uniref:Peptide/nickel transport system permease protein n=1 Tax=Haladaptatus litoreus TaxID=553468 RepID=A0A1N7DFV6_9EURY|nr:ABC transporter permease [Haladaptatus litoreus]SIR74647.1 peptide/nickel transport system permease protein [Haladaptatus litoreus]